MFIEYSDVIQPWVELQNGDILHTNFPDNYDTKLNEIALNILPSIKMLLVGRLGDCQKLIWADIGSGLGGIDIHLARHFNYMNITSEIHLLDGDQKYPTAQEKLLHRKPFNSMAVTKEFFQANDLDFTPHIETDKNLPELDFVVSFAAWGFHFPISTYPEVLNKIKPGGLCIVDLRASDPTNAPTKANIFFKQFQVIQLKEISPKKIRYVFYKNY